MSESDANRDESDANVEAGTDVESEPGVAGADRKRNPDDGPVEVGDGREKRVAVTKRSGERTEHLQVYLRHTTDEFVVSRERTFPSEATTRYAKRDLSRVEISQHHSVCFITTATTAATELGDAGDDDNGTLDALRGYRDGVLRSTAVGRALVGVYERVSPPVARTLATHPTARTTRLVRWLVERSAALVRRHDAASGFYRRALALRVALVYVLGVSCALVGHSAIRLRESIASVTSGRKSGRGSSGDRNRRLHGVRR